MIKRNKCPWRKKCLHGKEGCVDMRPTECVRFMPLEGNNFVKIGGIVELPPHIDAEKFDQYFLNWIESMGWFFGGMIASCDEDGESIDKPFIEGLFKDDKEPAAAPNTIHFNDGSWATPVPDPCKSCPNHPSNGGNGMCNCTLGIPEITC